MSDIDDFTFATIRNAIAEALDESAMVTKFTLVATVIDQDGSESIQTFTDCDHSWQVLGLLHHALLITQETKYRSDNGEL